MSGFKTICRDIEVHRHITNFLIAHILSKIIFMKYLPTVRSKMVPELKILRIC